MEHIHAYYLEAFYLSHSTACVHTASLRNMHSSFGDVRAYADAAKTGFER